MTEQPLTGRVFKTRGFARAARKAGIPDSDLCKAIREVMAGQADDLGGGVWKKRLDDNRQRSIILARGRKLWVYEYLFAKADRSNIEDDELDAFRRLAKQYAVLQPARIVALLEIGALKEICA